ncbi:MAG: flippase-like domain-containing protein [Aquificaceae bacterium]|nr:flippase-like domain-containing protein [Aquificaceae bacterium]MCX8059576.1 flippase-like domain-containing protein [Aquificaceae bacterium]
MKRFLPFVLTLLLIALLLYFVPFGELLRTLQSVELLNLLLAFFVYSLSQLFRSLRWRMLLKDIGFLDSFALNSANIMFNNLLPARTGELSWFYYTKKMGAGTGTALWSFFLGRLYDLLVLILLFLLSLSLAYWPALLPALPLALLGLLLHEAYRLVPPYGRLAPLRDFLRRELSSSLCVWLLALSLLSAFSKFLSLLILIELWNYPLHRVFLAFLGGELSSVLPLHSFMGLGTYEFAFGLPLKLLGENLTQWLSMAFVFHSFLLLSSLLWGLPSVLLLSGGKVIISPWRRG